MPIVDDMLVGLQIQIDTLWYNLLLSLAGMHWSVQRAFIIMGYLLELMNDWLVEHAFKPLITLTSASMQGAVGLAFVIALLLLGVTYLLAAFVRVRVVEPKSAVAWYLAAALFFTLGPDLYQGVDDFRRSLAQAFYSSSLTGLQANLGTAFDSLNKVQSSELGLISLCDNFGTYFPVWQPTIDGMDVALAYLRADGIDIMGYLSTPRDIACQPHLPDATTGQWTAGSIPWEWRQPGSFFASDREPAFFPTMTPLERSDSLEMASASQSRLLTAWPLVLFGVAEQLVSLLMTVAQGLTFIAFSVAVLFAFFKKTEVIARSIIDLWVELIVQTVMTSLLQALVITFFLLGAASGSGTVVLGVGLICGLLMGILVRAGVHAVVNSLNRLFTAFGQATGGTVITPGVAALGTAGAVGSGLGMAAATVGMAGNPMSLGSQALAGMSALRTMPNPITAMSSMPTTLSALAGAAFSTGRNFQENAFNQSAPIAHRAETKPTNSPFTAADHTSLKANDDLMSGSGALWGGHE